jgi:enolase
MSNKKQTAFEWQHIELMRINFEYATNKITPREFQEQTKYILEQAKEMENEQMRSYIEEKWKQYRIVTNEEDAWLFKEWLIQQTYGGNNEQI